jgi:hypothetical protein
VSDLHDTDIVLWSEQQAALLRRLAAARPNEPALDWQHIIEEIEDVGGSAVRAVRSLMLQILLHDLKCIAWPHSPYVEHWRSEARAFHAQIGGIYTPSMRRQLDIAEIHQRARRAIPDTIDGQPPLPVPVTCQRTLDDLLADYYPPRPGPIHGE